LNAYFKEIFLSFQGEAIYIGYPQLFLRFCDCNLKCKFCDTDFKRSSHCKIFYSFFSNRFLKEKNPININQLKKIISNFKNLKYHSIVLTGGEPLLNADFIKLFLKNKNKKIFLETNGTLPNELNKIINLMDIISMDIKLNSVSGNNCNYSIFQDFINIALRKDLYIKIIVNNKIDFSELEQILKLKIPSNLPIIIQPEMNKTGKIFIEKNTIIKIIKILEKKYSNIRFIPQIHKILKIR